MAKLRATRGRLRCFRARLGSLLALILVAGAPALAQTSSALQELEAGVTELKGTVDQAKDNSTLSNPMDRISTQVERVRLQLDRVKASNQQANQSGAAPVAAWYALAIVGSVFAVAWGAVSLRRETTRQQEGKTEAHLKEVKAIEEAVNERVKAIVVMLRETQRTEGSSMTVDELVKRAIALAEALTAIFHRGLEHTKP